MEEIHSLVVVVVIIFCLSWLVTSGDHGLCFSNPDGQTMNWFQLPKVCWHSFCTPGFVLSAEAIFMITKSDLENTGQWNLLIDFLTSGWNLTSIHPIHPNIFWERDPLLNTFQYSQYLLSTSRQTLYSVLLKCVSITEFSSTLTDLCCILLQC